MTPKTALLVIDVQTAFYGHGNIPPVHDADGALSSIANVVSGARSHAIPIIVVQHDGPKGHPMEPGAPGWELHRALDVSRAPVVRKSRPDAFFETDLQIKLDKADVSHLIVWATRPSFASTQPAAGR